MTEPRETTASATRRPQLPEMRWIEPSRIDAGNDADMRRPAAPAPQHRQRANFRPLQPWAISERRGRHAAVERPMAGALEPRRHGVGAPRAWLTGELARADPARRFGDDVAATERRGSERRRRKRTGNRTQGGHSIAPQRDWAPPGVIAGAPHVSETFRTGAALYGSSGRGGARAPLPRRPPLRAIRRRRSGFAHPDRRREPLAAPRARRRGEIQER